MEIEFSVSNSKKSPLDLLTFVVVVNQHAIGTRSLDWDLGEPGLDPCTAKDDLGLYANKG